jgi:hypothetical protein
MPASGFSDLLGLDVPPRAGRDSWRERRRQGPDAAGAGATRPHRHDPPVRQGTTNFYFTAAIFVSTRRSEGMGEDSSDDESVDSLLDSDSDSEDDVASWALDSVRLFREQNVEPPAELAGGLKAVDLRERPGRVRSCSSSPLDLTSSGPARGLHAPPGPNGLLRGRHVPPALLPHIVLLPRVSFLSPQRS